MSPQESIGHYRIASKLGEGGMGAVYRAIDTRLNREVAIKVLPDALAADSNRMARFTREAQVLASLNHPNIAAIYGIEQGALIMELVPGDDLKGPLPLVVALDYARQIAVGLEAAHEKGIIHRDLKPANIRITPDGNVKILDFGLAKATEPDAASSAANPTISPTLSLAMTQAGMILGTAAYMSPEQARGRPVDRRADIWAFGVVLYEMLTGQQLFAGETVSDTLANVLTRQPDFDKVPPEVRPLLRRCLERDPKQRLRDVGDAGFLLESIPAHGPPPMPAPRQRWPLLLSGAFAVLAAAFFYLWWRTGPTPGIAHRFAIEGSRLSLSRNGRWIINGGPVGAIRIMAHDAVEWRTLPGTEGASYFFWSPDSSTIGFFSNGALRTVSPDGTGLRNLAPALDPRGGTWRGSVKDGVILYSSAGRLYTFHLADGKVGDVALTIPEGRKADLPVFLPEGDRFVYHLSIADESPVELPGEFTVYSAALSAPATASKYLQSARQTFFAQNPHTGAWHVFFSQGTSNVGGFTVYTAPIDPRTGETKDSPVKILSDLALSAGTGLLNFDVGDDGVMLWRKAQASVPIWRLRWFDRNGNSLSTVGDPGNFVGLALSPDERWVAAVQGYPVNEIWLYNLQRGSGERISMEPGSKGYPVWSPDGRFLYYTRTDDRVTSIVRRADGGPPEELFNSPLAVALQDCTPDGKHLLLVGAGGAGGLYRLDLSASSKTLETLLPNSGIKARVTTARLIADGRWLVALAGNDLSFFPYPLVRSSPGAPLNFPRPSFFSPDGKTAYGFTDIRSGRLVSMPLIGPSEGRGIRLGEPSLLFPITTSSRISANVGAVTRDGARILVIAADPSEEIKTQVLTDWTTLLPVVR